MLINFSGGPHFGGLYVDEFWRRTPFWGGCMLMNPRGGQFLWIQRYFPLLTKNCPLLKSFLYVFLYCSGPYKIQAACSVYTTAATDIGTKLSTPFSHALIHVVSIYIVQIAKQNVMKNDAIFAKNNGQEKGVDDHDRTSLIHFCANEQIQKTTTTKKKEETRCQCNQST